MGTTADKLAYLNATKELLKDAINAKGGNITANTPFRDYPDVVANLNDALDPAWVDIGAILEDDTGISGLTYATNLIYIYAVLKPTDTMTVAMSETLCNGFKTSDGATYTFAADGASVVHTWDTSKDLTDSKGHKYRWVIQYRGNISMTAPIIEPTAEWVCFGHGFTLGIGTYNFRWYYLLRAITTLDERLSLGTGSKYALLQNCYSLSYLPPINASGISSWQSTMAGILDVPCLDILMPTGACAYTEHFFQFAGSTFIINNGGEYVYASGKTAVLASSRVSAIYGVLDARACAAVIFAGAALRHIRVKLPDISMSLTPVANLDYDSLTYICDNIVLTTTNTITLGETLIARAGVDNIAKLTDKGRIIA